MKYIITEEELAEIIELINIRRLFEVKKKLSCLKEVKNEGEV